MANREHLARLNAGVEQWNSWRQRNPDARPDLRNADLSGADFVRLELGKANLSGANFSRANLWEANLSESDLSQTNLINTDLSGANLSGVCLSGADLSGAYLNEADLRCVNLHSANLTGANLTGADLSSSNLMEADLSQAILVDTILTNANLTGCTVYGVSAWDIRDDGAIQNGLIISVGPEITVDRLEVAQFIYLLLNNKKIRNVIDTITSKVVLILGRFTPDRKAILDAIRDELRKRDYTPILFDFEKPSNRDITETVSTLAHMARFVIAGLSDPKSIPHELAHVAPLLPSVPIMPLIVRPHKQYAMFEHFFGFRHVLKPFRYRNQGHLLASLETKVILPAEKLANRVAGNRPKSRR